MNIKTAMRAFSILMTLLIFLSALPVSAELAMSTDPKFNADDDFPFSGGSGTEQNPYLITTAEQLAKFAEAINFNSPYAGEGVYYKLDADIDISGYNQELTPSAYFPAVNGISKGWFPIGYVSPFKGHFNGAGHVIRGLYIDYKSCYSAGLFSSIEGGSVTNLGLEDVDITAFGGLVSYDFDQSGGIASTLWHGKIENCYVTGKIYTNTAVAGGIVGNVAESSMVKNCYSTVEISGRRDVGGVSGGTGFYEGGKVENSAALNPSVEVRNNQFVRIGRVDGANNIYGDTYTQLSNNVAWGGMGFGNGYPFTLSEETTAHNGKDGISVTAYEINAEGFFEELFENDPVWTYEAGKLPGFGKARKMPAHLRMKPFNLDFFTERNPETEDTALKAMSTFNDITSGIEPILIVAVYDDLGNLIKCDKEIIEIAAEGESSGTVSIPLSEIPNGKSARAFLWDNKTMAPLIELEELAIS